MISFWFNFYLKRKYYETETPSGKELLSLQKQSVWSFSVYSAVCIKTLSQKYAGDFQKL